jgi:hypothetical protein
MVTTTETTTSICETEITLTTTTTTTTTTETTTEMTQTTSDTITTTEITSEPLRSMDSMVFIGTFVGSYYHGDYAPCQGGSGRELEDCSPKEGETKGSIACRYIQEQYGYDVNGRTRVYLELPLYPEMNGYYWVDDCCAFEHVVDFYFIDYNTVPWQNSGLTEVRLFVE